MSMSLNLRPLLAPTSFLEQKLGHDPDPITQMRAYP